jgi:transposase
MTSHPHITEIEKLMIVRMNTRGYTVKDIACATGYGSSTIYRILAKHRDTGNVVTRNLPAGCKRKLSATDVQVYA